MSTKILGHRIGDKVIDNTHLSDTFVITEGENHLELHHPTHSNVNDLTATEKAVLTQGGNADYLHYHTGGGGGMDGIYTHQQIDTALLQIMTQLNSLKYKLYHSIIDTFDDDAGIDYGISSPAINSSAEIIEQTGTTSLDPSSVYYYRLACKHKGGVSSTSLPFKVETNNEAGYRSVVLNATINPDNKGYMLWRTKTINVSKEVPFDRFTNLYSPYGTDARLARPDEVFNGQPGIHINYTGSNAKDNADIDILNVANGATVTGEALSTPIVGKDSVVYCATTPLTNEVSLIKLVWSNNPAYIPLDYIIEYSTITNPNKNVDGHWMKINDLQKAFFDASMQTYTDGDISSSSIINNTKQVNQFVFARRKVTGIRVTVTKQVAGVQLNTFAALYNGCSNGEYVIHNFPDNSMDITGYKSLIFDVVSDENPSKFSVGLMPTTSFNNTIEGDTNVFTYDNAGTNVSGNTNRVYRTRLYVGARNDTSYNKIKLKFRKAPNQRFRITNVTVGLNVSGNADILPGTMNNVTFNGLDYYDTSDSASYFDSDWVTMDFSKGYTYVDVSFCLEMGTLYAYGNNGNMYTWYADNNIRLVENSSGSGWTGYQGGYSYVTHVNIAKSFKMVKMESYPAKSNVPHTQILDISDINAGMNNLRGMAYNIEYAAVSGRMQVSNIRFANVMEIIGSSTITPNITASSTLSGSNPTNIKSNVSSTYWESNNVPTILDSENIMAKFNQAYPVSRIRIVTDDANDSYTLESYSLQYSILDTASVNDPVDSTNWINMPNLSIENAVQLGFTGTIENGKVKGNNLHRVYIDNLFDEVIVKSVRVVVHKTKGNTTTRINQVKVYTSDVQTEYQLIKNINIKQPAVIDISDNGAQGTNSTPNSINTTGSYNISYDRQDGCIRVLDRNKLGVFVSKRVEADLFLKYLINLQQINRNGSKYYISNDDGYTWTDVQPDMIGNLQVADNKFRFKAELKGDDMLSAYSVLYSL